MGIYYTLFTCVSVDDNFGGFQDLAITNKVAIDIYLKCSYGHVLSFLLLSFKS